MEYLWDLSPLLAIMAASIGVVFWWGWRRDRKSEREHVEALTALVGGLGGTVVDRVEARPWSLELLAPMRGETDGVINRMGQASRRRFEVAVDFRRGGWPVRVSEASVKKATSTSAARFYEHRVEVATSPLVPMRISRRVHSGKNSWGRPLGPDHVSAQGGELVREVPVTVAAVGGQWHRVGLPPGPFDAQFAVFTSDPAAAVRAFSPQAVEHLLAEFHDMPFTLHFEAGLVFGTLPKRIDPDHVLKTVDAILGLLERMGVAPAHPPVMT